MRWLTASLGARVLLAMMMGALLAPLPGAHAEDAAAPEAGPRPPPVRRAADTKGLAERVLRAAPDELEAVARGVASLTLAEVHTLLRELRRLARPRALVATRGPIAPVELPPGLGRDQPPVAAANEPATPLSTPLPGTPIINMEARVLEIPESGVAAVLGSPLSQGAQSVRYLGPKAVTAMLARLKTVGGAKVIAAPRLSAYDGQRANISVMNQVSYIRDFELEYGPGQAIGNPIVGVVKEGLAIELKGKARADSKVVILKINCVCSELTRPMEQVEVELALDAEHAADPRVIAPKVTIQIPEVTLQEMGATVVLPPGAHALLGGDARFLRDGVSYVRLLLVRAEVIAMPGSLAPSNKPK